MLDLLAARLLRFVLCEERLELVLDVGDRLAGEGETLFRGLVLLPLERVDLNFEF